MPKKYSWRASQWIDWQPREMMRPRTTQQGQLECVHRKHVSLRPQFFSFGHNLGEGLVNGLVREADVH